MAAVRIDSREVFQEVLAEARAATAALAASVPGWELCETIEAQLFHEHEIPWEQLAFRTVRETLQHFFADRTSGRFALHVADIG